MGVFYVLKYYYEQVSTIPSVFTFQKTCFLKRQTNALKRRAYYSSEYRAARPCCSKISSRFFGGQILPPPLYLYLFFYHPGCTVFLNVLSFQLVLTPICNQNPPPTSFCRVTRQQIPNTAWLMSLFCLHVLDAVTH